MWSPVFIALLLLRRAGTLLHALWVQESGNSCALDTLFSYRNLEELKGPIV